MPHQGTRQYLGELTEKANQEAVENLQKLDLQSKFALGRFKFFAKEEEIGIKVLRTRRQRKLWLFIALFLS